MIKKALNLIVFIMYDKVFHTFIAFAWGSSVYYIILKNGDFYYEPQRTQGKSPQGKN